jgi:hypothetical protein
LARSRRIIPAVPLVPMTTTGIQLCSSTDFTLSHDHGLPMYSGAIKPPMLVPNTTLATYMMTSASMKFGIAMPRNPSNDNP